VFSATGTRTLTEGGGEEEMEAPQSANSGQAPEITGLDNYNPATSAALRQKHTYRPSEELNFQ